MTRIPSGLALPRRTVRLRLTLLYGALFLISGAVLLAITYLLVRQWTGGTVHVTGTRLRGPGGAIGPPDVPRAAEAARLRSRASDARADQLHDLLVASIVALAAMAAISIGLGWLMAGRVLRPIENAFEAQRRFVANASHELRTPLAMMRTSLDVATVKPGPLSPQLLALDPKLREGLDRADQLLEDFLVLARAQQGAPPEQTTVRLAELVRSAVDRHAAAAGEAGIDVRRDFDVAHATGSPRLLAHMVDNLIDNAIRHNAADGWIDVRTRTDGDRACLVVENPGEHLEQSLVDDLPEPFRRLGTDRTRSERGVGLGLSIVAAVVDAQNGTLRLQARPQGGLRATVTLPCAVHAPTVARPT